MLTFSNALVGNGDAHCVTVFTWSLHQVRTHPGFPELVPGAKAAISGREPTFVDLDPPEHTKFRGFFEHAFTNER